MADFAIRIAGQPIRVNLGENTAEAARQANRAESAANAAEAAEANAVVTTAKVSKNFEPFDVLKAERGIFNGFLPGSFSRWTVGIVPSSDIYIDAVSLFLSSLSNAHKIRLQAWTRPVAVGDGASNDTPGNNAADVLIHDETLDRADLPEGIDWTTTALQEVKMLLPVGTMDGSTILFIAMSAFNASNAWVPTGAAYLNGVPNEPDYLKGYTTSNGNTNFSVLGGDAGTNGISYRIYTRELVLPDEDGDPVLQSIRSSESLTSEQATLTVATPAITIRRPSGDLTIAADTVTIDAPTTDAVADEGTTIVYDADGILAPGVQLEYQYISTETVTRTSDSAVLVKGTDYALQTNTGRLYGLVNTASYAATVSYTGHRHRYDLIYADAVTGALGVAKGTDRITDPEFDAWQPVLPSGKIALFKVYVYYDMAASAHAAQMIPVYNVRDLWVQSHREVLTERKRLNRDALTNVMRKLRRGERVDIAAVGDSRTHRRAGDYPSQAQQIIPGGGTRDQSFFYDRQRDTFTDASIPLYSESDPDFAALLSKDGLSTIRPAAAAGSGYSKDGYLWTFRDALAAYGGSEVNILNFGIGNTTSGTGSTGGANDGLNGSNPTLIDAVKAVNADLVSIAYGMNNSNAQDTYGQIRAIIEEHLANGSEVIVWAAGQVNSFGARRSQAQWAAINEQIERAANDTGVAFIPLHALVGSGFEGAMGISRKTMSAADLYVHQGIQEDRLMGRFGASLVL